MIDKHPREKHQRSSPRYIFKAQPTEYLARLLLAIMCMGAGQTIQAESFDSVREKIKKSLVEESVPSIAVAVARNGEFVWEQGFGWANREQRILATEHTMYSIASISKPITATALMVLVDRDRVDLDRPINRYLRNSRLTTEIGDIDRATIRRVANHTAGLPLHYQFFYVDEPHPLPTLDESIRRYGRLVAPPGELYQYANFGYGVLGHVIELTSEIHYADFLRSHVFLPLGMTHSAVGIPAEFAAHQAVRYGPDQRPLPFYDFDHPGASAIYSSAHDLVRFGQLHLKKLLPDQKAVLKDRSINEMQRPTADVGDGAHYGIGWFLNENEHGFGTVSHTGGMGGVRTRLVLVPSEGLAVAVLCNASTDVPLRIAKEILGELLPKYGENYQKSLESKKSESRSIPKKFSPSDDLVGQWQGEAVTYQGNRHVTLNVQPDGDVHVRFGRQLVTLLNEPHLTDGYLSGVFGSDIQTDDVNRRPYQLHLKLKQRGDVLDGAITATSLPAPRLGNAISHWVRLTRFVDANGVMNMLSDDLNGWRIADKYDFKRHGPVEMREGELVLGQGAPASGVSWQGPLPLEDYEVTLDAKRIDGNDFFCGLTFPVATQHCTLIVGGWGGGVTGLSNIDGMSAVENETTNFGDFQQNQWYAIRLKVTSNRIEAWIDDKQLVDVERSKKRFSIWWEQEPVLPFGIASWSTKAALRNIKLRHL